jgi:CPA2 family monovalent cation:H+ antiporter-2
VLFFVSVGMLLNPRSLMDNPLLLAGTLAVVMLGKPAVAFAITWLLRSPFFTSLSVAVALAQIGEFSFMLSRVGVDLGLLTSQASNVVVAVAIISIVLNPVLYRLVKPADRWTLTHPGLRRLLDRSGSISADVEAPPPLDPSRQAIVVGYGPTGRTVTRLLRDNGFEPRVIEMNVNTVRELREQGVSAIYGDATHRDTLAHAGAAEADNLILTSADMADSREAIRHARELNPGIHVLARAPYLRDLPALRQAGAEDVVSSEGEVGLALTEMILQRMGATPDQMDRERDRVRSEFRPT